MITKNGRTPYTPCWENAIKKFKPQVSLAVYNKNREKVEEFFKNLGYRRIKTKWEDFIQKSENRISDIMVFAP